MCISSYLGIFRLTAAEATATSQELSISGKAPGPSRAGIKYPVQESLTSTNAPGESDSAGRMHVLVAFFTEPGLIALASLQRTWPSFSQSPNSWMAAQATKLLQVSNATGLRAATSKQCLA